MRSIPNYNRRGFSLIEAVVASVILAGTALAVCGLAMQGMRKVGKSKQTIAAMNIIDRQLAGIDYMGIDAFIKEGKSEGVIEQDGVSYAWSASTTSGEIEGLYDVTVTVAWKDGSRVRSEKISTMLTCSDCDSDLDMEAEGAVADE